MEGRPSPVRYSVVVPAYNEAESLPTLIGEIEAALAGLGQPFEAIIVDDGSTDGTLAALRAESARRPWLRYLSFTRNAGQSAAFDAGFRAARGDVIITLDADLENNPADIPLLVARLGEYDAVCGVRTERKHSRARRLVSFLGNRVRNWFLGTDFRDTGCSLKAFRRECVARVPIFKGLHRFLNNVFELQGFRVLEVPVSHRPRQFGQTKYGTFRRAFRVLPDILALAWMKRRWVNYQVRETNESQRTAQ
jgi:glycosyltransferase involved in cell wall biosynthesis